MSCMCAVRTSVLAMMEVSYWNGLQMLQYSSVLAPIAAVVQLIRIGHVVVPLVAVILPGNAAWRSGRRQCCAPTKAES